MINTFLKQKHEFIENYLEKLVAGLGLSDNQIAETMECRVFPGGRECYYLGDVLVLEFLINLTKDKIELIFKVVKI